MDKIQLTVCVNYACANVYMNGKEFCPYCGNFSAKRIKREQNRRHKAEMARKGDYEAVRT